MKKSYVWIIAIIVSLMTLTTICYFTMIENGKTNYANGQLVDGGVVEWDKA